MAKYIFSHLEEFEKFKEDSKTAIITDVDGTISRIAPKPDEAVVTTEMKNILTLLANKFKLVAVVSGRSVEDVKKLVGLDNVLYVGNHGLEYLRDGKIQFEPEVERYIPIVKKAARTLQEDKSCSMEGVLLEDKGVCFCVHYRMCSEPEKTRKKLLKSIESAVKTAKEEGLEKLSIKEGRKVLEIKPPAGYDKGTILEKIVLKNHVEKVLYLGDDITDNDAFCKIKELRDVDGKSVLKEREKGFDGESILVLSGEIPYYMKKNASFFVKNVDEVQKFFEWLAED